MTSLATPPNQFHQSIQQLHDRVIDALGADDFGPQDYLEGLNVLLLSLDYDPQLTEKGRQIAWDELFAALYARAHTYQQMAKYPDCEKNQIISPVVITGLPRSGTTALHKLLAVDPRFQGLQTWLIGNPMPRPPVEDWQHYDAFQKTLAKLEQRYKDVPEKKMAHQMVADEVDECCLILRQDFRSNIWTYLWSAASYDVWLQTQSELSSYQHLYRAMQVMGHNTPSQRWLLKNPGHIQHLDTLFAVFPDAKVIQTHRDPAKAIPSLAQLLIHNHKLVEEGRFELRTQMMAIREMEKWADACDKADNVRAKYPTQILDIYHRDFHASPIETVQRIYKFIDEPLDELTQMAMQQRIIDDPERKHGKHQYNISDFGLSEQQVRQRFANYIGRYNL